MKTLTDTTRNWQLQQKLKSSNCYSYTRVTYIDDDSVEQEFYDAQYPIRIDKKGEPPKYANVNYNPATAEVDFNIVNRDGAYTVKNTASALSGLIKRDRIFKFYDGKWLKTPETEESIDLDLDDPTLLYVKKLQDSDNDTTSLVLDVYNAESNEVEYFTDLFPLYDAHLYGSTNYAMDGYAVWTLDRKHPFVEQFTKLAVTANSSKVRVYWRSTNSEGAYQNAKKSTNWRYLGNTINGSKEFDVDKRIYRYIQIALIWDTGDWDDAAEVTALTYYYENHVSWVLLGSFYLDDPDFQDKQSPNISTISLKGRNAYKRALETKINTKDLSVGGGTSIDDYIKDIADEANIDYTTDSIADLSSYGDRQLAGGYGDEVNIDVIFTDIMDVIGKTYRMWVSDDNVLYVQLRPTNYLASWVQNYQRYINAEQKEVTEKQLQRFTIVSARGIPDKTEQLGTATYLTSGTKTINWAGNAIYKYPTVIYNAGNVDGLVTGVTFTKTSAEITITGAAVDITVEIWGDKWTSGEPTYYGEAVDVENINSKDGFRSTNENPVIISDAEAITITEDRVAEFGDPGYDIVVTDAYLNPLPEINDQQLFVSEDFFEDTLYIVRSISYILESDAKKYSISHLADTGRKYTDEGALVWDRSLYNAPAAKWDGGMIWDANHRIGATKDEILTDTPKVFNVDFN